MAELEGKTDEYENFLRQQGVDVRPPRLSFLTEAPPRCSAGSDPLGPRRELTATRAAAMTMAHIEVRCYTGRSVRVKHTA